jgi:hypothetical protein
MDVNMTDQKEYSEMTIIALVQALKVRGDAWPEKCTNAVLQAIDHMALYLAEDVCEHYEIKERDPEESLELLEGVLI